MRYDWEFELRIFNEVSFLLYLFASSLVTSDSVGPGERSAVLFRPGQFPDGVVGEVSK